MALAISSLARGYNNADATSYATTSVSPTASSLLVLFYASRHGTTAPGCTPPSAYGGTWTELGGGEQVDGVSAIGAWWLRCSGSPGTAGMTVTVDGGVTAIGFSYDLIQITGASTGGSPFPQAIYGPTGTTSTTIGLSSAAPGLSDSSNGQLFYGFERANASPSAEAGWTSGTVASGTTPTHGALSEWRIASFDSSPTMTIANNRWQSMYLEVSVAPVVFTRWRPPNAPEVGSRTMVVQRMRGR